MYGTFVTRLDLRVVLSQICVGGSFMRGLKELAEQFLGTASGLRYHLVLRTLEGLLFRVFQELS